MSIYIIFQSVQLTLASRKKVNGKIIPKCMKSFNSYVLYRAVSKSNALLYSTSVCMPLKEIVPFKEIVLLHD